MTLLTHHLIPHVLVCTSSTLQVRFAPLPGSATGNCHVNRAISKLKSHTCSSLIGFSGKKQSLKLISNAWIVCLAKFHRICLNCKVWNCLNMLQICLPLYFFFPRDVCKLKVTPMRTFICMPNKTSRLTAATHPAVQCVPVPANVQHCSWLQDFHSEICKIQTKEYFPID